MIEERKFGRTIAGEDIVLYSLKNKNGMQADVMNFGAILVNLFVPDKNGEVKDVVLGYDRAKDYFVNGSCFGSTIGPVANRTAKGQFELDGTIYNLIINDNDNNLHSDGNAGLHKTMWQAEKKETENAVTFSVSCKDGLLGFPGNRKFAVTYKLTEDNALEIHYFASTDKDTLVNMTNHSYFNLNTQGSDAMRHFLEIESEEYMPVDRDGIPTGEICDVCEVMDFSEPKRILTGLKSEKINEDLINRHGYDHNYVIKHDAFNIAKAAVLTSVESGRRMTLYANTPGLQFYSGNFLEEPRTAICLEPQYFPDALHHSDDFYWNPQPILEAGLLTKFEARYEFSVISPEETDTLTDLDDILDDLQL